MIILRNKNNQKKTEWKHIFTWLVLFDSRNDEIENKRHYKKFELS